MKVHKLNANQNHAFIMSPRLGDALLSMIIVHNLQQQGYKIDVYSNYLFALKNWYPNVEIYRYPDEAKTREVLSQYDVLMHTYPHDVLGDAKQWHPNVLVFDDHPLHKRCVSMVNLQVMICEELLGLQNVVRENGLQAPKQYAHRFHSNRVVVHPMASLLSKCWLPKRFETLARRLQFEGYQPEFVVAPNEREQNQWVLDAGFPMPEHESLDALAGWIYESGWFIGNDSGIGHLASNLGIPTVSLMQRRKTMQRWRPDWAPGRVLLPSFSLVIKQLKERYWKYFISVTRVMKSFEELRSA